MRFDASERAKSEQRRVFPTSDIALKQDRAVAFFLVNFIYELFRRTFAYGPPAMCVLALVVVLASAIGVADLQTRKPGLRVDCYWKKIGR